MKLLEYLDQAVTAQALGQEERLVWRFLVRDAAPIKAVSTEQVVTLRIDDESWTLYDERGEGQITPSTLRLLATAMLRHADEMEKP